MYEASNDSKKIQISEAPNSEENLLKKSSQNFPLHTMKLKKKRQNLLNSI